MSSQIKKPRDKCSNICAVRFCKTTSHTPGASLFRFPKDPERCKQWVEFCGCDYLVPMMTSLNSSMYRVCHLHFENVMFTSTEGKVKRLSSKSIPTQHLSQLLDSSSLTGESTTSEPPIRTEIRDSTLLDPPLTRQSNIEVQILSEPGPSELQRQCAESCRSLGQPLYIDVESPVISPLKRSPDASSQTPKVFGNTSPRKQKLRKQVHNLQHKITGLFQNETILHFKTY